MDTTTFQLKITLAYNLLQKTPITCHRLRLFIRPNKLPVKVFLMQCKNIHNRAANVNTIPLNIARAASTWLQMA